MGIILFNSGVANFVSDDGLNLSFRPLMGIILFNLLWIEFRLSKEDSK